mgnify:FL=1
MACTTGHWFYYIDDNKYVHVPHKPYNDAIQQGWTILQIVDYWSTTKPTGEQLSELKRLLGLHAPVPSVGDEPIKELQWLLDHHDEPDPASGGSTPAAGKMGPPASGGFTSAAAQKSQKTPGTASGGFPPAAGKAAAPTEAPPVPPAAPPAPKAGELQFTAQEDEEWASSEAGCNKWHTANAIHAYVQKLKEENLEVQPFQPEHSVQFGSIQDYVSTLRYEASQENSHFQWPFSNISFEIGLAIALHHMPPGFKVTIENGRKAPPEIASPKQGYTYDYFHGTSSFSLLNGIIRHGLRPVFGAGSGNAKAAWGIPVPMVYLSMKVGCAAYYPSQPAFSRYTGRGKETMSGGEIIARDGTPPLRIILHCQAVSNQQLWSKKAGKKQSNDQRAFMPQDVHITHITWYALKPEMVAPAQLHYVWEFYGADGNIAEAERLMPNAEADGQMHPYRFAYAVIHHQKKEVPLDITRKSLLSLRMAHQPTLVVCRTLDLAKPADKENIPAAVLKLLKPWQSHVPVLERTQFHEKDRNKAPTTGKTTVGEMMNIATPKPSGGSPPAGSQGASEGFTYAAPQGWSEQGFTNSSWYSQAWDHFQGWRAWDDNRRRGYNDANAYGYYSSTWGEGTWGEDRSKDVAWEQQASSSEAVEPAHKRTKRSKKYNTQQMWQKQTGKTYTRYCRMMINGGYEPINFDYHYIDEGGNYQPLPEGFMVLQTTIWPIPSGDYPHPKKFVWGADEQIPQVQETPQDTAIVTPTVTLKPAAAASSSAGQALAKPSSGGITPAPADQPPKIVLSPNVRKNPYMS